MSDGVVHTGVDAEGKKDNSKKLQPSERSLEVRIRELTHRCLSNDIVIKDDTKTSDISETNSIPELITLLDNDDQNKKNKQQTQPLNLKRKSLVNGNGQLLISGGKKRKINQPRQIRSEETSFNGSVDFTHPQVALPPTLPDNSIKHVFEKFAQELKEKAIKSIEVAFDSIVKKCMSIICDKSTPNTPDSQNEIKENTDSEKLLARYSTIDQNKCAIVNGEHNNQPDKALQFLNTTVEASSDSDSVSLTSPPMTTATNNFLCERLEYISLDPISVVTTEYNRIGRNLSNSSKKSAKLIKAKHMFFWVRYPKSNLLKEYFPDIKSNKKNTAQLVKWFSNFREFFYRTIEMTARKIAGNICAESHAESAAGYEFDSETISELIRVFNVHYNQDNKEIPKSFQTVIVKALHEFVKAIQAGRDTEQNWKKSIYKVISQLDKSPPDYFKPSSLNH